MRRSLYTSKFSAVLLSYVLAAAFGSASQSPRSLPERVHGIPPAAGGEKGRDETGGDMLSHVLSSGAASPKSEHVNVRDPVALLSNKLQFGPPADVKLPHQIPLHRYSTGDFNKLEDVVGRGAEPKHVVRAGSRVKLPKSGRRKRSTEPSMKDNKGDHGDHPLTDEPGAKVHCWNEAHVFDVVLPASEVSKHFPHECQDPLSCNTTCVAKVPGREVCARLISGCTKAIPDAGPETQLGAAQKENKQLKSFEKNVERRMRELEAKLEDKLVQLGRNLNHLSEALKEQLSQASVKNLDSLDRNAAKIESLFNRKSESMMAAISSVFSLVQSDSKTHLWTLKGYAANIEKAMKNGRIYNMVKRVYIGRYLMSWGIEFKKTSEGVTLYLVFQLHRGSYDDFIEWPFSNELKLSIIHPESGEKQEGRQKPVYFEHFMNFYARPVQESNEAIYFSGIKFESSYLERNGYVKSDQLLLMLEVLS